jgi:spermidine synthase
MLSITAKISLLVFGSGFCALVYQMAWLRLLRLIFGSSTPATAAVLAIFMGGLGAGSLILGPRSDRQASPLGYYARLELGIALTAAASPFLILLARWIYIFGGGSQHLGTVTGSLLRIVLATLVLGLPTFLMGGTLPAVTRAVEQTEDRGRRLLGVLYGANTLGAVLGALTTTFFSIEVLGIRRTIWVATLINLLVVVVARRLAQGMPVRAEASSNSKTPIPEEPFSASPALASTPSTPTRLVLLAAAVVGFAFFLMELVWYRMLAPLLGGSSYTFGLILAVALLGIGAGGLLYGVGTKGRRPSMVSFSVTCSLEALFFVLPLALGDRLAVTALVLRDMGGMGFSSLILSWSLIVAVVVLPGAIVAGYQFPLLVAILGKGGDRVGTEVGWTYGWNTAGAILGSLAGGFGLIPLLSATGTWRFVVVLLVALATLTAIPGSRPRERTRWLIPTGLAFLAFLLCFSTGPTSFWRHSPIGAGRVDITFADENELTNHIREKNRLILWQADGRESSIAMQSIDGASFLISGKVDGHARGDASTQVLGGLLGAALHPKPEKALVIGLGTGSTAGWLAQVGTIDQVDVVELEPDIVAVAQHCEAVNQGVLHNPKVNLIIGDGREILLTSGQRYDVVFSEPSNPYRAGIASLFTSFFYEAVSQRLTEDGIFIHCLLWY